MGAPTFYRINLESLTPDLYNAYLAGDYICECFDNVFGSILNNNESYLFIKSVPDVNGLCEAIDQCESIKHFKTILDNGATSNRAFDYNEINSFYNFAKIDQESYVVAVTENESIIGIGQFTSRLYYNPNNAPYNETEIVAYKEESQHIESAVRKGRRKKEVNDTKYKEVRCVYPYCRKIKWLRIYEKNSYVLKNTPYPDLSKINNVDMIEMIKGLIEAKDDSSIASSNVVDDVKKHATETQLIVASVSGIHCPYAHNRIFFGAPGTGKSYLLEKQRKEFFDSSERYERVTFHPDYSYANFVGTYKPVPFKNDAGDSIITYEYVPGPFMRIYVEALKHPDKFYLLAIEEINRANVAAVFGDVFQLLDRDDDGSSMYPIHASEDLKRYIAKELGEEPKKFASIRIPSNMYIWATMNSADQGVFPMDTAFKRRWEFEYIGINTSEQQMSHYNVQLGQGEYAKIINWNKLRRAINEELICMNVNEDKLMGPFFLSDKVMKTLAVGPEDNAAFIHAFKNKVLMYLFDDAAKQKRGTLFDNVEKAKLTYSSLCEEFDQKGVAIFCDNIINRFINPDNEEQ
ncbi:MAG: McrB family protein [Phascolarctobacterium sp.]